MNPSNIFHGFPTTSCPSELIEVLLSSDHLRIERIVSLDHASPEGFWYDQPQHEWVLLIQGSARLRFEDVCFDLNPGDWIDIPPHRRHRIDQTDPTQASIWLAIHYGETAEALSSAVQKEEVAMPPADAEYDAGPTGCGELLMNLRIKLKDMAPGTVLKVKAYDPGVPEDLPAWCRLTGHLLLEAAHPQYWIERRKEP